MKIARPNLSVLEYSSTQLRVQLQTAVLNLVQLYTQCAKFSTAAVDWAAYTRVHSSTLYYSSSTLDLNLVLNLDLVQ
jgi:hypothetical protein